MFGLVGDVLLWFGFLIYILVIVVDELGLLVDDVVCVWSLFGFIVVGFDVFMLS